MNRKIISFLYGFAITEWLDSAGYVGKILAIEDTQDFEMMKGCASVKQ